MIASIQNQLNQIKKTTTTIINKIGITYNTMKKLVVQRRVEGAAVGNLYELHERVQHEFLEHLISLWQSEDVEEGLKELFELGTEPGEVDELELVVDSGGSGGGGGGRELGEEREEEGVKREEGFEDVVRRGRKGNEGEEKKQIVDVRGGKEKPVP